MTTTSRTNPTSIRRRQREIEAQTERLQDHILTINRGRWRSGNSARIARLRVAIAKLDHEHRRLTAQLESEVAA